MSSPLYAPVSEVDDEGSSAYRVHHASALNERSPAPLDPPCLLGDQGDTDNSFLVSVRRVGKRRRYCTAAIFTATTVLLFADQNLMAPNLTAIAQEFHFTDEERDRKLGGDIALAFFVLGAPASYLVGCLADSEWLPRSALFSATVGIGEGACLLSYFARTYGELYACRAVTGFSLGGALPLIYSFLGDLFSAEERHTVSALVGIGTGIGISFGQGLAGLTGPRFGWRLPFLLVSIPALMCALLVLFFVNDPPRGGTERAVQDFRDDVQGHLTQVVEPVDNSVEIVPLGRSGSSVASPTDHSGQSNHESQLAVDKSLGCKERWITFTELLSTPTVILALLQGAPGCVPWGIVNTYLNDFLSQNRGMTVEVRICFALSSLLTASQCFLTRGVPSLGHARVQLLLFYFSDWVTFSACLLEALAEATFIVATAAFQLYWLVSRQQVVASHSGFC
jgi:MFS family permease